MTQWWILRTEREQALIVSLLGLMAVLVLYFTVIRPVLSFRDQALQDYRAVSEVRDDVQAAATKLFKGSSQGDALRADVDDRPPRIIASASARQLGLGITRIQPLEDEAVSFWFDQEDVSVLYSWIVNLNTQYSFVVSRVDIQKSPEGDAVNAQVVLRAPK
ncbi:MAG: type II secretion system protein GspM [Rhodospirillaceae bacterium]